MTSLRRHLFGLLVAATGAVWLCAVAWIWLGSRSELEHVLDTRLREAARMVHSLVVGGNLAAVAEATRDGGYSHQLSCQVWSLDGRLVARSGGAPDADLTGGAEEGFADRRVADEPWRVYTLVDRDKGVRVAVGDRIGLRDRLARNLVFGLIVPAGAILPLLAGLIWLILGRGLRPLRAIADDLAARDADDMRPIAETRVPVEVRPLVSALDDLFGKVETARRHEREVTAFAAHELRTPLAGLKTQAQIALSATDDAVRARALRQILVSVDRSGRLVRQLLALARLEARSAPVTGAVVVGSVLGPVIGDLSAGTGPTVDVDPALDRLAVPGDAESLGLILRNLHENALEHGAADGRVVWRARPAGDGVTVEDDGPGIAEDEIALVTQRFYRGRTRSLTGTGLGLTIAAVAAARVGARLDLANRPDGGGLVCSVIWPRALSAPADALAGGTSPGDPVASKPRRKP